MATGLQDVRDRIVNACAQCGRDPAEVTLVAVTKTFPASDVRLLAELGVRDIGESRDQEARNKAAACADLDLTWHFVGQLQTNKARSVVTYATVVQSVDRPELVRALDRAVQRHREPGHDQSVEPGVGGVDQPLRCLVQVRLDDRPGRGGADPAEVSDLADQIAGSPLLRLGGVMAVAPLDGDPAPAFARLAEVAANVRARHADATWISAGMSDDLEQAVAAGATHVRVGRGLLGVRPSNR
ncbi:YggS family pyridoxal phosphate-dependent enzyme [Actinopolymorpha sp. B11F2]|uniref:YggS family pyridoxal phosphate-dependent enzyme n=1 Tax=Actinopolymorpha sp. B11F2 TaxID=3160862 RepID=UPI0032E493E9